MGKREGDTLGIMSCAVGGRGGGGGEHEVFCYMPGTNVENNITAQYLMSPFIFH